jgi:hypothetical protein
MRLPRESCVNAVTARFSLDDVRSPHQFCARHPTEAQMASYPTDNPMDGRGGEVAAGRAAMPEDAGRLPAPTAVELLTQLMALQRAANGISALQVSSPNYIALMSAYRRERDATEALVERAQAALGMAVVGSFPSRVRAAAEGR